MHWRRKWQPTPVFLPGESQGRGAWWAAIYGVAQSRTRLSDLAAAAAATLEKEMASHLGILAWGIPWTEKPGRLQSMGSQTVEHDLVTE